MLASRDSWPFYLPADNPNRNPFPIESISRKPYHSLRGLFYWTAAAAFPLMFYLGSRSKKSALFALIGKARLSVSPARQVIQPILFECVGNWKPAKMLSREMNFAGR